MRPPLETPFEHFLRNGGFHELIIWVPRNNENTDRETFVGLDETESWMKTHVADFGTVSSSGGLPHEREMVCVVAAWKQANVMAGTELQTDTLAKVHDHPVTMLPCDSTSVMTEFKTRYGKQIPEEKLPARSYFEHNSERLADGALKAEPLAFVVSAFEEEQQDMLKNRAHSGVWYPSRLLS